MNKEVRILKRRQRKEKKGNFKRDVGSFKMKPE